MIAASTPEEGAVRIDLAGTEDFELGGVLVSPARREVRANGERHELEPRVAQVLVALASVRPNVVSRDSLIDQCWDGRIVGNDALNRCVVALRHLAKSFSPEPYKIETVSRVGYCLIETPVAPVAKPGGALSKFKWVVIALAFLVAAAAGTAAWSWLGRGEPTRPSIAVLTFRNLSSGAPFFAQGVSEEILGQLAREPHFRVLGSSTSSQFESLADFRDAARDLGVEYVVQGSVRSQGNRVRVNAEMLSARDGSLLWSDSFDGSLDDIFEIQQRIGTGIAGALKAKLVRTAPLAGPMVTDGDAYSLYLTAKGLLRTRNRKAGPVAVGLLRDAIDIDPDYAPAWASMAEALLLNAALEGFEPFAAAIPRARQHARHALELAPDFADAHRALARTLPFGDPRALTHFREAVELDSRNAENLIALGTAQGAAGEFALELATYRRAHAVDPLWFRTVGTQAVAVAEMGNRAEADAIARRGFAGNPIQQNLLLARIAWIFGDISQATSRWSAIVKSGSARWGDNARRSLNDAALALGLDSGRPEAIPYPLNERVSWQVWMDRPPSPAEWRSHNRGSIVAEVYRGSNIVAAKLMLKAGRTGELMRTYGSAGGLLGIKPGVALRVDQLGAVPLVAQVLRASGRDNDAARLLREADAVVGAVYDRGEAPFWFDADAAAIWAEQGRDDKALDMLERAAARGWVHFGATDLPDIADEPAFRSLRTQARFIAVRSKLMDHMARERSETARLHL